MRPTWLALALSAIVGCGPHDPCSATAGACLAVVADPSPSVSSVDRLAVQVTGSGYDATGESGSPDGPTTLPVTIAIALTGDPAPLALAIDVTGFLGNLAVGEGAATVNLAPGEHATVHVQLSRPTVDGGADAARPPVDAGVDLVALADLEAPDLVAPDLATRDLVARDLAAPDLASLPPRLVFLSAPVTGNLLSVASADALCTNAANAAGHAGQFASLLATNNGAAVATRVALTDGARSIVLPTGTQVATDATFFGGAAHLAAIDQTINGNVTNTLCAWTDFKADGSNLALSDCTGWTTSSGGVSGSIGDPSRLDSQWADAKALRTCNTLCHLYCIAQ